MRGWNPLKGLGEKILSLPGALEERDPFYVLAAHAGGRPGRSLPSTRAEPL